MFTVIYRFQIKNGLESQFEQHWHDGTLLIRNEKGGLGSRLHRSSDGTYVAYAQWPSRDAWKNPSASSEQLKDTLQKMKNCLNGETEITFEMEVIDDLLVK